MYAAKTEMLNWKNMCTPMIIAPLFTIAKTWKQPKPPSIDDWFKKMWYTFICVCVGSVPQLCPTLCDPVDCRLPGSSVHEIFQARILEWVAISYSSGSSRSRDRTHISCLSCIRILYHWATREATFNLFRTNAIKQQRQDIPQKHKISKLMEWQSEGGKQLQN